MKNDFNDMFFPDNLEKRTIMVSAFPALVKEVQKEDSTFYEGFLPGFEFNKIEDFEDEEDLIEYLQELLDDEVEKLVEEENPLPNVLSDEELLKMYKGYKIVYLDINVYVQKE